jgi:sugar transferase (PEP-CTERM/EpsH1 system associated)
MFTIVQCVNNMDLGGVEQLVLTLSRHYREKGYGSLICCIEDHGVLADQAEASGVKVHALQIQQHGKYTGFRDMRHLLRKHRPVVLHSHNFKPFYYSALATLFGVADGHVHSRHGSLLRHHPAVWRYRLLSPWVDEWVTVSADRQQELAERTGLPREHIHVLANGVDTSRFSPTADKRAVRTTLGLEVDRPAIVCVSRLAPEKDLPTLLRAFAIVRQTLPTAELWFVGYGPEQIKLEVIARDIGITDNVRFFGQRSDTETLLQAADVFALSSLSEGLSVALIEAAATGLPIVATDVGGNYEIVQAPHGGRLVPVGQPDAMAKALLEILTNDALRQEISHAARQHAVAKFWVEQMVDGYLALYEQALRKRGLSLEPKS